MAVRRQPFPPLIGLDGTPGLGAGNAVLAAGIEPFFAQKALDVAHVGPG